MKRRKHPRWDRHDTRTLAILTPLALIAGIWPNDFTIGALIGTAITRAIYIGLKDIGRWPPKKR